ncbi:hypothetical protein C0V77_02900 [Emticicia sp. TH156]|nr:hypothetical protein C0V77_02900 [Emticicia sp. TH156]
MIEMKKLLHLESFVARKTNDLQFVEFDNETVIMDLKSGNYINLNHTGAIIWLYLEQPILVKDLIQKLMQKFKVEESQCTIDTLECLNLMYSGNIVVVN